MNAIVEKAKLSRKAVSEQRITRAGGVLADPGAVTFPAQTLPNDSRIPVAFLQLDLDYLVPKPTLEDDDDFLEPQIRRKGDPNWISFIPGQYIPLGPIASRDWNVPFKIPQALLVEEVSPEEPTVYEFRYVYWAGGANDSASIVKEFAVDLTAPYKVKNPPADRTPAAATWPTDLPPDAPIDEVYLTGKTNIPVKPATYASYLATDNFKFYWGPAPDPSRDQPVFDDVLSASGEAELSVDVFRNGAEGDNLLIYVATDLPGNQGRQSNPSRRKVRLLPIPDPVSITPPVIPLANGTNGDDLIDLADTQLNPLGVAVEVTVPQPNAPTDTIVVYWGSEQIVPEQPVGTETLLTFYAPYSLVQQVYGNTDGAVKTNVSYKMFRGAAEELATHNVDINVDISYVGPDPINIGLDEPTLRTAKGNVNEIKQEDFEDPDIKLEITLFTTPPTEEGWLIDVFYEGVKVADAIALTTGQEGTTLEVPLPWDVVFAQGTGTKKSHYVLYTLAGVNPTTSRARDVVVDEFPITLAMPTVLKLQGPLKRIACATLNFPTATRPGDGTPRRNLEVLVPKSPYTVDGEQITVTYQAYKRGDPNDPIPGTEATSTFDIVGTYPDAGQIIFIGDYSEDFRPAHNEDCRVTYSISRGGPGNNPTPDSIAAIQQLDLDDSEGNFCEDFAPTP